VIETEYTDQSVEALIVSTTLNTFVYKDLIVDGKEMRGRVKAINGTVESEYSGYVFHTIVAEGGEPAPCTNLTGVATLGQIAISWTNPADLDLKVVEIFVSNTNAYSTAELVNYATRGRDTYTHPVSDQGVWYYFWLRARDYDGNYSLVTPSSIVGYEIKSSGEFTYETPFVPVNIQTEEVEVLDGNGISVLKIRITWNPALVDEVVTGYTIYGGEIGTTYGTDTTTTNSILTVPVYVGRDYEVQIRADNNTAHSDYSTMQTITPVGDITAPAEVTNIAFTTSGSNVYLTWDDPTDLDFSVTKVYRGFGTDNFLSAPLVATTTTETYSFAASSDNQKDYFWLITVDTSDNHSDGNPIISGGGYETTSGAGYGFEPPLVPTGVNAVEDTEIDIYGNPNYRAIVSWVATVSTITGYTVLIDENGGTKVAHSVLPSETSLLFNDINKSTYNYQVRADNNDASSAYSASQSLTIVGDTTPPAPVTNFNYTTAVGSVTVTWSDPSDADFSVTKVYSSDTNDWSTATWQTSTAREYYTYSESTAGVSRYFWLRSFDTSGNLATKYPDTTVGNEAISGYTYDPPSVPTGVYVVEESIVDSNGLEVIIARVHWTAVSGELTGYTIALYESGDPDAQRLVGPDTTELLYYNVKKTTYYFKVRADNNTSHSLFSAVDSITLVGDETPPGDPSNLAAYSTVASGSVALAWTIPTDIDYNHTQLFWSTSNSRPLSPSRSSNDGQIIIYDLSAGVEYFFWVRAVDHAGNPSGYHPLGATAGVSAITTA